MSLNSSGTGRDWVYYGADYRFVKDWRYWRDGTVGVDHEVRRCTLGNPAKSELVWNTTHAPGNLSISGDGKRAGGEWPACWATPSARSARSGA